MSFGADANVVNKAGKTALDIAAAEDNEPLVKLLSGKCKGVIPAAVKDIQMSFPRIGILCGENFNITNQHGW